jgi:plasmid maintenance system antidote protein VapI
MRLDVKVAILRSRRPQYELAQAIGVSEYRLSKYVHGRAQLQPEQEAKLAALLNLRDQPADAVTAGDQEGR